MDDFPSVLSSVMLGRKQNCNDVWVILHNTLHQIASAACRIASARGIFASQFAKKRGFESLRRRQIASLRSVMSTSLLGADYFPRQAELFHDADRQIGNVELPPAVPVPGSGRKAWWLLCQPSPKAKRPTHQRLRLSSFVS